MRRPADAHPTGRVERGRVPSRRAQLALMALTTSVALAQLAVGACGVDPGDDTPPPPPPARTAEPPPPPADPTPTDERDADVPRLPALGELYPETQVRLVQGDPRDARQLANVATCGACHAEVLRTWQSSAHARASFDNPWYRQSVDTLRREAGPEASRFCAGCHDPVLLVAGAVEAPIEPDDPRAHAGITCNLCHGIQEVHTDGAGSYTLSTRPIPLPDPADEAEVREHVAAATPAPLRTAELCGSCHRGFLGQHMGNPHFMSGFDDVTPYQRSSYAGNRASLIDDPVEPRTCQGCHMPMTRAVEGDFAADEQGLVHAHRFAGGHTAMAFAADDVAQLIAEQAQLRAAARIDIASARRTNGRAETWAPAEGAPVRAGDHLELDVVIANLGTGHRFPGGTMDTQDTWVEVEVRDARGALVAEHGAAHAALQPPRDGEDDEARAHRLMAIVVNDDAAPQRSHRVQHFRAEVANRTVAPRDAQVVRYAFEVPGSSDFEGRYAFPLLVRARLRHRRHNPALHADACEAARSSRGRAFARASRELGHAVLDPCRPQPISELAEARVFLGEGSRALPVQGGAQVPTFRRHFDHALGLLHDVQEQLDAARPILTLAFEAAGDDRERAMVEVQRARLEGHQGRVEDAIEAAARAERLFGPHPAIARARGDAYAQVWRWAEAAAAYAEAAEGAPTDDSRFVDLARSRGSAGDDAGSLRAARAGLLLSPRDESLLRSQYLALEHLTLPGAEEAREAFVAFRAPDVVSHLRQRCGQARPYCNTERLPVHTHALHPVDVTPAP